MSIVAILRRSAAEAIAELDPFDARLDGTLYITQVCDRPVTDQDVADHVATYRIQRPPLRGTDLERYRASLTHARLRTEGKLQLVGGGTLSTEAKTPFVLAGIEYPSLRLFYEALKLDPEQRAAFLADPSHLARRRRAATFVYRGTTIPVGSTLHLQLIAEATSAKVAAHAEVQRDLRATGRARLFMGTVHSQPLGRVVPFAYMVERQRLG